MSSEMKTIWIVGAKGRVGKALMRLLDERQYKLEFLYEDHKTGCSDQLCGPY